MYLRTHLSEKHNTMELSEKNHLIRRRNYKYMGVSVSKIPFSAGRDLDGSDFIRVRSLCSWNGIRLPFAHELL